MANLLLSTDHTNDDEVNDFIQEMLKETHVCRPKTKEGAGVNYVPTQVDGQRKQAV